MQTPSRKQYHHNNRLIYQWQQSLDSITLYLPPPPLPPSLKLKPLLDITFKPHSLTIGLKNNPPYLHHQTQGIINTEQSLWYTQQHPQDKDKKEIVIELQKAQKGTRWGGVFKGHGQLNLVEEEQLKKKMMLERFQQEHPGFDFSQAEFNGVVPEARTFMGGVKYG